MAFSLNLKNAGLPQDKKQQKMLIIFAVLAAAIIVILYFGFWRSSSDQDDSSYLADDSAIDDSLDYGLAENPSQGFSAPSAVKEIDFDISFLTKSPFKDLGVYAGWPLEIGEKGRANPFLPY